MLGCRVFGNCLGSGAELCIGLIGFLCALFAHVELHTISALPGLGGFKDLGLWVEEL